ncbi:MAG: AAA family ATPase [Caldilineaceae bacterium]
MTELAQSIRSGLIVAPCRAALPEIDADWFDDAPGAVDQRLIVRQAELTQLQQAWAAPSQVVMVQGDAGSGKTSLIDAFVSTQPGTVLLTGRCYESTRHALPPVDRPAQPAP